MDSDRFDNFARAVDAVVSRQRIVRFLAGFSAAGLAALSRLGETTRWGREDVLAKKKRRKKKRQRKKKKPNRRCPGKHDRVCHCPPGNTDNCHTTGNGGGHFNHKLDCCCTLRGRPNPRCSCDGNECCKPAGTDCDNSSQCCDGLACNNGVCGTTPFCVPLTCADFSEQCGTFDDGCQGEIDCTCPGGGCCNGVCMDGAACCRANDCPRQLCQDRACAGGTCTYTPVDDNDPGPLCVGQGRFCCNGDECCTAAQVCTDAGCCTPLTCADFPGQCGAFADGCGGQTAMCTCPNPTDTCEAGTCVACEPLTCADFPNQCGTFADGCDGEIDCACASGGCCDGVCTGGAACCQDNDCPRQLCQVRTCDAGACAYTPVDNDQPGPLCVGQGQSCCNGDECCAAGAVCLDIGCCSPQTQDEACAGSNVACGTVSDGCGGEFDCGDCTSGQTCSAGACVSPRGGRKKRCKGHGLAGQPCRGSNKKGKKCKCKGGRRCHNKKCCEPKGDGSRHCNADSDCCPGLRCLRRRPDQHKVCASGGARSGSLPPLMSPPGAD